jgi:hypothetical protein
MAKDGSAMKQQARPRKTQTASTVVTGREIAVRTRRRHNSGRSLRVRKQVAFLTAFAERGNVQGACMVSGVGRRTIYHWLECDESFAQQFDDARQTATDVLEAECHRRAVKGVPDPVFYQGKMVGQVQRYSDVLLLALLNAYRPEQFRRQQQHSRWDAGSSAVVQVSYDPSMKPDDLN